MALRRWPHREESSVLPPPQSEPCAPLPQARLCVSPPHHRRTKDIQHKDHRDQAKPQEPANSALTAQQKQRRKQENTTREAPHNTHQNRFGDHKKGCIQQIAFFITTVFYTLSSACQAKQLPRASLQPYPLLIPNYPRALHQPPQPSSPPTLPRLLPAAPKRSDDQPRRSYHRTLPPRPPEHASNAPTDHVTHSTPLQTLNRYLQTLHLTYAFGHITQLPTTHTSHTSRQVSHYHTFTTQLHPHKVYIHYHTHNEALTRGGSQPTVSHSHPYKPCQKRLSGPPALLARHQPTEESTPTYTQPHARQKYSYNVPPHIPQATNRLYTHTMQNAHSTTGHNTQPPSSTIPKAYSQRIAPHSHTPTIQSSLQREYPKTPIRESHQAPALHPHSYPPDQTNSGWPSAPPACHQSNDALPSTYSQPHARHINPYTTTTHTPFTDTGQNWYTQPFLKPSKRQHSYQLPSNPYRNHQRRTAHTQRKHPKLQPYTNPPKSITGSQLKLPEATNATAKNATGNPN